MDHRLPPPGTILTRPYKGQLVQVQVLTEGFAYAGRVYPSLSAVARAVYQREVLLVSAPTGIGKTIAALYPAVKQSLKLGKKLFFLTSKTLQQDAAIKALEMPTRSSLMRMSTPRVPSTITSSPPDTSVTNLPRPTTAGISRAPAMMAV